MAGGPQGENVKRVRNEILVALLMIYPAALQADQLLRSLLALFPTLEWQQIKRDIFYLAEKGYVQRVVADTEEDERLTPWRRRWFRITPTGMEVADRLINDPAIQP